MPRPTQDLRGSSERLILDLSVEAADDNANRQQHNGRENAGFRANAAAGKPRRTAEGRVEEVVIRRQATIGYAIEVGLSPIPSCVKSNHPPKIAGATHDEAEEHAKAHNRKQSEFALSGVGSMGETEQSGQKNR